MEFQKTVLTIAIILLIVILVLIGIALSKAHVGDQWPPIVGECPDYWVDLSGNGAACYNKHSLGRCNLPSKGDKNTMNFNQSPFTSGNTTCTKYNWANTCNVTWDGITSGIANPCDETSSSS